MFELHLYPNLEFRNLSLQMERNYFLTNTVGLCTTVSFVFPVSDIASDYVRKLLII